MAVTKDTILSQIPNHILEDYPRFYLFLKAYYSWLEDESNPYAAIKDHLDYLSLDKSLDSYMDVLQKEYLSNTPVEVRADKGLFIKWAKKLNLSKGSRDSYRFIFKALFDTNEGDEVEFYNPSDNILRTSDGDWVFGESVLLITDNHGNADELFGSRRIVQKRQVFEDIYEYAYATVEQTRRKFAGKYIVTELFLRDLKGTFLPGYPIENDTGDQEWIYPTLTAMTIDDGGTGYQESQQFTVDGWDTFTVSNYATEVGLVDTNISSLYEDTDIVVRIDGVPTTNFTFDGHVVTSNLINISNVVEVDFPVYQGYIVVDEIKAGTAAIASMKILDSSIGDPTNLTMSTTSTTGVGAVITPVNGYIRINDGYYTSNKGHLSSNMYLQDSYYYQDYSYELKTSLDVSEYKDIILNLLHPSGFLMFGTVSITELLSLLVSIIADDIQKIPEFDDAIDKYGMGPNYSFYDKFFDKASRRVYVQSHFDSRDPDLINGVIGYNLEDTKTERMLDSDGNEITGVLKGWMTQDNLEDYHLFVHQNYNAEVESGDTYFESGYISDRT